MLNNIKLKEEIAKRIEKLYGVKAGARYRKDGLLVYRFNKDGSDKFGVYFSVYPDAADIRFYGGAFTKHIQKNVSNVYKRIHFDDRTTEEYLADYLAKIARKIVKENLVERASEIRKKKLVKGIKNTLHDNG